jgi:ABC-2 type transport system permease protein
LLRREGTTLSGGVLDGYHYDSHYRWRALRCYRVHYRCAPEEDVIAAQASLAPAVFFLLGYLLYSTLYATLGAIVNSDQEAQQWQMFVTLPIVVPIVMMTAVLRQPNAGFAVWMSLVPFFSPILMFARVVVQTPPMWQIVLSIGLLVAAIYAALWLCSRIYRVGILMYGKKPTLPEIVKWVRYA